jgi:hypothetical protein
MNQGMKTRSEVLISVITVFCDVTTCIVGNSSQCFERACASIFRIEEWEAEERGCIFLRIIESNFRRNKAYTKGRTCFWPVERLPVSQELCYMGY